MHNFDRHDIEISVEPELESMLLKILNAALLTDLIRRL